MINLSKPLIPKSVSGSAITPYGVAFATGGGQAWGLGGFPSAMTATPRSQPAVPISNWMGGFPAQQEQPFAPVSLGITTGVNQPATPNPVASLSGSPTTPAQNASQRWQGGQPVPMDRRYAELGQQQINDERAASRYKGRSAPGAPMARTEFNIGRVAGVRFNNSASNWTAY